MSTALYAGVPDGFCVGAGDHHGQEAEIGSCTFHFSKQQMKAGRLCTVAVVPAIQLPPGRARGTFNMLLMINHPFFVAG